MSENPFAEPGDPEPADQDRTVIRPMPGGARGAARLAAAAPPKTTPAEPAGNPELDAAAGDGPLAIAAAPLLHLLARLRNTATAPDPGDMRDRTRRELRAFERRAKQQGVPPDQLRLAHYALCAALDDVVLNTPWGGRGRWREQSLARELHDDDRAADGFFDQIRSLRDRLPDSRPVLELMFLCLSLGVTGAYRTAPDGPAQLERIRHRVYELIASSAPAPAALAPMVAGVDARFTPGRGGIPVWVVGSVALAAIAGAYAWSLADLNAASDAVYETALAAPPAAMPALVRPPATPPPPALPPPPGPAERLRAALAGVADVEVLGSPAATTIRIPARALFRQPNATPGAGPPLDRVAAALLAEPGPIHVLGYTDALPARSVGFPSNFALSTARAKAVRGVLAQSLPDPHRIVAEGRAEADPVAPNSTPDGRERNRRVDIVLPAAP